MELVGDAERDTRPGEVPHAAAGVDLVLAEQSVGCGGPRAQRVAAFEGVGTEPVPRSVAAVCTRLRCANQAVHIRSEPAVRRDPPPAAHVAVAGDADDVDACGPWPDA